MPITFHCGCGKSLRVPDTAAGKRARCPVCQTVAVIPTPAAPPPEPEEEPVFEVVEREELPAEDLAGYEVAQEDEEAGPDSEPRPSGPFSTRFSMKKLRKWARKHRPDQ